MKKTFSRTPKQIEQTALFTGPQKHLMSYGGSRSGKTFGICRALAIRASKVKSRHLAIRLKFNHCKTSLWYETFPKVFDLCFPGMPIKQNRTDWFYQFPNGSEIWIGGLDEKERTEKILGKEYSSIYFNECSQIPYTPINMALTRLAEKNGLRKKAFYDENPPTKRHWSYPLFVKGLDPNTWEPKANAASYGSILMNPADNAENIDDDYITEILDNLPERERLRFRDGQFTDDSSGSIYYAFKREVNVREVERDENYPLIFGMDFNVNPFTFTVCQIYDNRVHVIDEGWIENSNTDEASKLINEKWPGAWRVIPDSTGKRKQTSSAGLSDHQILKNHGLQVPPVLNPFRMDRYNEVNALLEKGRILISPRCTKLIKDLEQVSFKDGTNMPETKDTTLTHISDGLGYVVHWAFPLVRLSSGVHVIGR